MALAGFLNFRNRSEFSDDQRRFIKTNINRVTNRELCTYVAQASIAEEISRNAYVDTLSESAQLKAHADPLRNKPLQDSSWYQITFVFIQQGIRADSHTYEIYSPILQENLSMTPNDDNTVAFKPLGDNNPELWEIQGDSNQYTIMSTSSNMYLSWEVGNDQGLFRLQENRDDASKFQFESPPYWTMTDSSSPSINPPETQYKILSLTELSEKIIVIHINR
jgi:hypothetical protein